MDNSGNQTMKNTNLSVNQLVVLLLIFFIFVIIGFMIEDKNLKISYILVVGLALFTGINLFLTIKYYKDLRNKAGEQGPRGLKGEDGPQGDVGVCTFSEKCGMNKKECENIIYKKIIDDNYYGENITRECLENPTLETCNNDIDLVEKASALKPLVELKIKKCIESRKSKEVMINELFPPIHD